MSNQFIQQSHRPADDKGKPASLLHLTIKNTRGSVEHFYHFVLGFLLPLAAYFERNAIGEERVVLVRSCGPLDRIMRELELPGLVLCERKTHAGVKAALDGREWAEVAEIRGFDLSWRDAHSVAYNSEGIITGTDFLRRRLQRAIGSASAEIASRWTNRPRILIVERGPADPYYQSPMAELAGAGTQRRTIANHAELVEALKGQFGGCRNVTLEPLSLAEQIAWFELADIVVAQHGAALSNVVWMRRGTHVIEISYNKEALGPLFGQLAAVRGISHSMVQQNNGRFGPISVVDLTGMVHRLGTSLPT